MFFKKKHTTIHFTDIELLEKYKTSGDSVYFGEFFKRYTHLVLGVCLKYLHDEEASKDAVMQIFEKLLQDISKQSITNFKNWLYTVSKNHCLMELRKKKNIVPLDGFEESEETSVEFELNLHLIQREEELIYLQEAMSALNEEQRICIELFYIQEKCYKEVAELTGYSMNQVKSNIQNGKRNLKNHFLQHHGKKN